MGSQSSHLYHATYSVFCTEIFENVFSPHRPPLNKWSVLILYMKFFYMYATYTKHFKYSKQEMCSKHWLNGKMKISVTRKVFSRHWRFDQCFIEITIQYMRNDHSTKNILESGWGYFQFFPFYFSLLFCFLFFQNTFEKS